MNHKDFVRVMVYLRDKAGKPFPHGYFPGAMGESLFDGTPANSRGTLKHNVAETNKRWESYSWNPPEYLQEGQIYLVSRWGRDGVMQVQEKPDDDPNFQHAYSTSTIEPGVPDGGVQTVIIEGEVDFFSIPDAWSETWPGEPCWMIRRAVRRVPKDRAITGVDPDAFPKPTWDELVKTLALLNIQDEYYQVRRDHDHVTEADAVKRRITDKALLDVLGGLTYVGDGLDHMTGLLQMVEQATMAGAALPLIELRDENHNLKKYHLQSQLRKLLVRTSERENVVECCHNRVIKPIIDKWKAAEDETRKWPDRLDDMNDYADLVENYETLLKAEMERFDPDELPEDLPELREKYIEMLEGVATGHQQWVKGALTQQAIDNWAACVEVDQALQEISLECAAGSIAIANVRDRIWKKVSGKWEVANPRTGRVDHEGDDEPTADIGSEGEHYRQTNTGQDIAKAAYEKAVQAIRAVSPINVPEITYAVSGRKVTIRAEHPDTDPPIRGQVTIDSSGVGSTDGSNIVGKINAVTIGPSRESDPIISRYEFADDYGGKIRITLTARNVCGPAEIVLALDVTANGSIEVE